MSCCTIAPDQAALYAATPWHQKEEGVEFNNGCIGAPNCPGWVMKNGSMVACDHFKDS